MVGWPIGKWIFVLVLVWCVTGLLINKIRPAVVFVSGIIVLMLGKVVQPAGFIQSLRKNPL